MKRIIEAIKDFIYDSVDYFIILSVVLVVSAIIGWRLPILFASDLDKQPINDSENIVVASDEIDDSKENDNSNENSKDTPNNSVSDKEDKDTSENDAKENDAKEESNDKNQSTSNVKVIIKVEIPQGSLGPKIADILYNKGLISDSKEFLIRSKEMKLDTKLQSGTFSIEQGSSLDDVIKIVSRQ